MTTLEKKQAAINQIGFEYFKNCIANGATPDEAKSEMMTDKAQKEMANKVNQIIN